MRNNYRKSVGEEEGSKEEQSFPKAGNWIYHSKRCVTCKRMTDGRTEYKSERTGRTYKIRRHYTCQNTHNIYLVTCKLCNSQYTGQTKKTMAYRHAWHRDEIKRSTDGIGEHFHQHSISLNLNLKIEKDMESIMEAFDLTIIGSVQPDQPWSARALDRLEEDLKHRL